MQSLHDLPSYYQASAHKAPESAPLQTTTRVDVCVIGAGITGLVSALKLAEKGYRVAVVEANEIGHGASGRSGGQAIFGWAVEQRKLEQWVGYDDAHHFWQIALEGLEKTKQRIRDYGIDCDWRDGMVHLATKPAQDRALQNEYHQLVEHYGYTSLEFWDRDRVREQIASSRYTSGMYDSNSGHLHPLNYTLGLARAAVSAGAAIYTHSPVIQLSPGALNRVTTLQGAVDANHVIIAGNGYLDGVSEQLNRYIMPVGTFIGATEPLTAARCESLIKQQIAACDINLALDYYRFSRDHRLLFGGRVSYSRRVPRNLKESMRLKMLRVFPQLSDVAMEYAWGGWLGVTLNRAPHFGRLYPSVYFAQGYSGHGMVVGAMAGELMAEAVATNAERFDIFSKIPHRPFPGGRMLRTPALVLAMTYYRIRDAL
ncbi:NAD(P)/FAD-dependent oxidoreductase [Celerinatantimonas diazotrophica]|uniref:Gamma-glutamylputrescine oxidase n=1 Tax=Celerinatantimonas diazotrophica TaxID=412034 RepID=A0A4V2PSI2_9GAMM|nr:FAD-binding oxidoreductase [Celerinatantimonas diazotrophica]TCK62781.1 gamma-glutamylputrescine oxidase [Celerinatantimonas diazotrophica]CAG9298413.1 Gamma-glutamylputrescine oxidoreductase [Celerinatantimonas diazotrophica]